MKSLVNGALEIVGFAVLWTSPIWIFQFLLISYLIIPPFFSGMSDPVEIKVEPPVFNRYPKGLQKYLNEQQILENHKQKTNQLVQNMNNCKQRYSNAMILYEKEMIVYNNKIKQFNDNHNSSENENGFSVYSIKYPSITHIVSPKWSKDKFIISIKEYSKNQYNISKCLFHLSSETNTDNSALFFHLNELYKAEKYVYELDEYSSELYCISALTETMTRWLENSGIPKEKYKGMINHFDD